MCAVQRSLIVSVIMWVLMTPSYWSADVGGWATTPPVSASLPWTTGPLHPTVTRLQVASTLELQLNGVAIHIIECSP